MNRKERIEETLRNLLEPSPYVGRLAGNSRVEYTPRCTQENAQINPPGWYAYTGNRWIFLGRNAREAILHIQEVTSEREAEGEF